MDDTTSGAIFLDDLGDQFAGMSPEQFADLDRISKSATRD